MAEVPRFTLRLRDGATVTPEIQVYLETIADKIHAKLEVPLREEWNLSQAELMEALTENLIYGTPVDVQGIVERFSRRASQHGH